MGVDALFQQGNHFYDTYNGEYLVENQEDYYPDPADLNVYGVPYGFTQMKVDGKLGYPMLFDINFLADRAYNITEYLATSNYIAASTKQVSVILITYNPTVMQVDYFDEPIDIFRAVLEVFFVLMLLKSITGSTPALSSEGPSEQLPH
eukprot:gene24282-29494_t